MPGAPDIPIVNAWTQWGRLNTIVVGRADPKSCHLPHEPACHAEINDPHIAAAIDWPGGCVKHSETIKAAAAQLDNFCAVLEAETVRVKSVKAFDTELQRTVDKKRTEQIQNPASEKDDVRVLQKGKISTLRPTEMDWSKSVAGPHWDSVSQYCATCPRDTMITLGNTILEGTMSKRSRYFEHLACRDISLNLWRKDPERVRFWACPKPSMADSMYNLDFFDLTDEQRFKRMRSYEFCVNEKEPIFDAADITRVGKDIFVQKSMVTNDSGIKWLTTHFPDLRVHPIHFPYDLYPSHIDCTFVPLRPPSGGSDGLALINPERPPLKSESELWRKNGWKFLNAPLPAQFDRPPFSQSSYWLSMNLLSISPNSMVIEENEIPMYDLLRENGFDPITVPMRHMYDFGGAIHCSTWDIQREDSCVDYFPNQEWTRSHLYEDSFNDIDVVDVMCKDGFVVNPAQEFQVGTLANVLKRQGTEPVEVPLKKISRTEPGLNGHSAPSRHAWEKPYREKLADLAVQSLQADSGGDILEVGFASGFAANRFAEVASLVRSHTIVESDATQHPALKQFEASSIELGRTVPNVIKQDWVDALRQLKKEGRLFDAIIYDACSVDCSDQHLDQFIFIQAAWELLKPGGRFVYSNVLSIGRLKKDHQSWEELWKLTQLPYLTRKLNNFAPTAVSYSLFEIPKNGCIGDEDHYPHEQALCPVCIK